MPLRFVWFVPLLAGILLLAGCSASRKSVVSQDAATNGARAIVAVPRETPEEVDRRAEAHARYLAGLSAELNGETERAEREYEKALELDPGNEGLALDLSRRFIQRRDFDRAAQILTKAADAPSAAATVLARLAFVHLQLGKTNEAINVNQLAIKKSPKSIAGYQSLYTLYRGMGQTNDARQVLELAAKQKNVDSEFLVDLGTLYLLDDAPKAKGTNVLVSPRAREALTRAAEMNPTNIVVMHKLAQGLRLIGDTKKAAEIYKNLVKEFPEAPGVREELVELLLRSNDTAGAAEHLEALARDNPTNPQTYYFLGAIAYEQQRYREAVDFYRKALLLKPDFEQVYYDVAAAKIALNEGRDALDYLRTARRQFKQSFVGEFFTAIAYVRLKEFTNALYHFSTAEIIASATESNKLTHTFYFQFGSACERAGKIADAEKHFERALAMSPDFSEALNYLGYMWAERGTNLARARQMIERAVSLQPTNAAYLDSLGWVLFKQGQAREALPHIEKAIELNDEPDATLYDHLGDILSALNQPEKARDAWKKAIAIEPNKDIEKKLNGIESASGKKPGS